MHATPAYLQLVYVSLVGLGTTSSVMMGAALGLYLPMPKKVLASILAFAAGSLIAALAIELSFSGARDLMEHGAGVHRSWGYIACGFAVGAALLALAWWLSRRDGGPPHPVS